MFVEIEVSDKQEQEIELVKIITEDYRSIAEIVHDHGVEPYLAPFRNKNSEISPIEGELLPSEYQIQNFKDEMAIKGEKATLKDINAFIETEKKKVMILDSTTIFGCDYYIIYDRTLKRVLKCPYSNILIT